MNWKIGDWAIFDLSIVQIKRFEDGGIVEVSDGSFSTSGRLGDRLRPLTLRGKSIIEYMDHHYMRLRDIDGEAGFNYPDIFRYFSQIALNAIDGPDEAIRSQYEKATHFLEAARDYKTPIDGVPLFRRSFARHAAR